MPRLVTALEPGVRAIVARLVDGFAADGRADLVGRLAYPLPMEITCTLPGRGNPSS